MKNQASNATLNPEKINWNPFLTVSIGGYATHEEIITKLKEKGISIGFFAPKMINAINLNESGTVILARANTLELGFRNNKLCEEIINRIKAIGSNVCPLGIAPKVALQYSPQDDDEALIIVTDTFNSRHGKESHSIDSLFVLKKCKDLMYPKDLVHLLACPISSIVDLDPAKTFWVFPEPIKKH